MVEQRFSPSPCAPTLEIASARATTNSLTVLHWKETKRYSSNVQQEGRSSVGALPATIKELSKGTALVS